KHDLDVLGVVVLGFVTALGGGLIRDMLLQYTPVAFIDILPSVSALAGCFIAILLNIAYKRDNLPSFMRNGKSFLVVDAVGLSAFTVIGASMGAEAGMNAFGVILLAAITGVGGGVIRDMLVAEVPLVLKADFYATATIIGGATFALLYWLGWSASITSLTAFIMTLLLRVLAIWLKWQLPKLYNGHDLQ
ncbi:MAG TPA: TRIC cation channel family protein, partial [Methanocella sp.]|nr:TRIC cation channel family protein [Methanocella sp.]